MKENRPWLSIRPFFAKPALLKTLEIHSEKVTQKSETGNNAVNLKSKLFFYK